jgi:hypothetical protein
LHRNPAVVEPTPRSGAKRALPRGGLALACALASVLGASAPGCGERDDDAVLADRLVPHEEAVERLGAWALRATRAVTPQNRARVEETLFAPVLGDPRFVVVQVERVGRTPIRATWPRDAQVPAGLVWTAVRSPRLGLVSVAPDASDAAVIWARIEVGAPDPTPLVLTLALRPPGE